MGRASKEAQRRHYLANKKDYHRRSKERKRRLYEQMIVPAKDRPCVDCHHSFPLPCMEFDHVRGRKKFTIASNYDQVPLKVLLAEIKKCDVVCANCHRIRHFKGD